MKTDAEIRQAIAAQAALCKGKGIPHFAPENGNCWACSRNIYQDYDFKKQTNDGKSVGVTSNGKSGVTFISGCPHCSRSFVD